MWIFSTALLAALLGVWSFASCWWTPALVWSLVAGASAGLLFAALGGLLRPLEPPLKMGCLTVCVFVLLMSLATKPWWCVLLPPACLLLLAVWKRRSRPPAAALVSMTMAMGGAVWTQRGGSSVLDVVWMAGMCVLQFNEVDRSHVQFAVMAIVCGWLLSSICAADAELLPFRAVAFTVGACTTAAWRLYGGGADDDAPYAAETVAIPWD